MATESILNIFRGDREVTDLNNLNTVYGNKHVYIVNYPATANGAPSENYGCVVGMEYSASYAAQLAIIPDRQWMYYRRKHAGTWDAWIDLIPDYNTYGNFVDLSAYTSSSNQYTFPWNGYVTVNDTGGGGGHVYTYFAGTNSVIITGISGERQALYVKKGMSAYLNGTVTSARFYPLNRFN